jgi:hypothetical protein
MTRPVSMVTAARMGGNGRERTASTRSSDVFPAFCRPIMVMSISVALSRVSQRLFVVMVVVVVWGETGAHQNRRTSQSHMRRRNPDIVQQLWVGGYWWVG